MARPILLPSYRRGTVGLVVALGLALSFVNWRYAEQKERGSIHTEFIRRAQTQASLARERLRLYEEMVFSLRATILGQQAVTRQEFTLISQELFVRHKGVQALEWVQLIPGADRPRLEAELTQELGHPFFFNRRDSTGRIVPVEPAAEHCVILYIEPLVGNEVALGYDLNRAPSGPTIAAARSSRRLKVTPAFRLTQSTSERDEFGVVFVLPVFNPLVPESPVTGFVQSVFRIQTMLAQSHRQDDNTHALNCYYLDLDANPAAPPLLYANLAGREPMREADPRLTIPSLDNPEDFHDLITIGDRRWLLAIQMDPTWAHRQRTFQPYLVLAGSLVITALLSLFIHTLLQRTARVEHEVTLRTAQLRETEARLQAILDHSPAMIFVKDLGGRYVLYNQAFTAVILPPAGRPGPFTDFDIFPADLARNYQQWDQRVLASRAPVVFEENVTTAGGDTFICLTQKFPLLDAEGHAYALCGIATDITQRKQAELERQESRRQLDNLISQLPGAAFRCAADDNMTAQYASDGMLLLTGYSPEDFTSGRLHIAQLTEPADRARIRQELAHALKERHNFEIEYRIRHRDGSERWILVRGRPVYTDDGTLRFLEGLAIDVTALKQAEIGKLAFERKLLETQKLESLGVMAGGIAHDFNNILTAVLGNASLTRMALQPGDPGQTNLLQIEKAALRAADLCSQMLAYAGKGKLSTGLVDLSQLVQETTSLLEVSIGKNCQLDLQLAGALPSVMGDSTQLHQIVMNLVINASDAIGTRIGGRITVTTFARQAEPALFQTALHQPKLPAGPYVGLEVRDNGCGMTAEIVARIFDPFFTTKFSGRGLGLSAVLGIVQGHHGALFVESKPMEGSTFRLLLPAATPAPTPVPAAKPAVPAQPLHGTILIVDDEDAVRLIAGEMLRRNGATVLLAADGNQALDLFRQQREHIDLILLDLTMPGLSGEDVLRQLQQLEVRAKIVIMSGYSEEETMQRCAELGVAGFLRKPFDLRTLLAKLQPHLG